eukprot:scaffold16542_cov74-Cyclotella_meneghiniana.AAC.3
MVDTIKFNVGGRHFEPLFIDRDGEKFAHVLDYLRYGSIELPESIPEAMFKRELDYYGVKVNDGSVVQLKKKTLVELRDDVHCQFNVAEKNKYILDIAIACFNYYNSCSKKGGPVSFYLGNCECGKYWMNNGMDCDGKAMETLSEYLEQYFGLDVISK